jgi:putative thioredoxin
VLAAAEQLGVQGAPAADGEAQDGQEATADGEAPAAAAQDGPPAARPGSGHPGYDAAQQAMERGDLEGAAAAFEQVLASTPDDPVARVGLAQVDLIRRVNAYDQAKVRREAAEHPDDVEAQAQVAEIDLAMGKIDEAFDRLLGTVRRTSGDQRDQARRRLLSLFEIFPPRDPRVTKARSTLSSLLF